MSNPIPARSREIVALRDKGMCLRCRMQGTDLHHRRGRSVADAHQHCPCNLITLCRTCHDWVHAHPFEARAKGWIVSRHADPSVLQLDTAPWGWSRIECNGNRSIAHSYEREDQL